MGGKGEVNECSQLSWLDENYLSKILSSYEGRNVKIKCFKKKLATNQGENFASLLYLVDVDYLLEDFSDDAVRSISMIVKSRLESELMDEIEGEFNVFEREAQVYQCIMTSCENLLRTIGDNTVFGPRALYVDERVIVQENLKEKGYGILDVKNGMTFEECKMVIEKIAKFHATTMVLHQKDPNIFRYHQKGNLTEKQTPLHDLYKNTLETCLEVIKTIPDLQQYSEKIKMYKKDVIKKLANVFNRRSEGINVLNHGDLWVNNFMFKKDSAGNILDVLLVDYQEGYFGSPGIDWNYFIYSSWQKDVYFNFKEDLILDYYNILTKTLSKLKYSQNLPTLEDIRSEIKFKRDHGLITATCLKPILISNHPDLSDPSTFLDNAEDAKRNRLTVFSNEKYVNFLKIFLKDFVAEGAL